MSFDISHDPTCRGRLGGGSDTDGTEREDKLRGILRLAVTLLCITGLAVAPASAGDGSSNVARIGGAANETATKWFVELSSPPASKGTSKATLKAERDAFKANAAADGVKLTERYSYDSLWNGVSVSVDPSQIATLRSVSRREGCLPGGDAVAARSRLGERRRLRHRSEERGRAHGRGHRAGRARARRLRRDDRDHGQRSRLHAPRVRRLFRPGLQGARRVRPRGRRLQRDPGPGLPVRFRNRMRIPFPAIPTLPTAPRSSAPAPRMPHTARTSRGSQQPTDVGTQPTARSSVSLRAPSCWPTGSSAATAARTAT